VDSANVLVMGFTFKENCPDLRNTKVVDIVNELKEYNIQPDIFDPWCSNEEAQHEYGVSITKEPCKSFSEESSVYLTGGKQYCLSFISASTISRQ
ncbi:MAG: hypothetical protein COA93_12510, partial [Alphaproteobacteria bacterium]